MSEELKNLVKAIPLPASKQVEALLLTPGHLADLFKWCPWLEYSPISHSLNPWSLCYDGESSEDVGSDGHWLVKTVLGEHADQWQILTDDDFNRQYQVIRTDAVPSGKVNLEVVYRDIDSKTIEARSKETDMVVGYLKRYCDCWYFSMDQFGYDLALDEFELGAKQKMEVAYRLSSKLATSNNREGP